MSSNRTQAEKEQQAITNLLIAQEEGRVPSTCLYKHHVHTPFALCDEILGRMEFKKIPPVSKYLVMFNLEFLHSLKKFIYFDVEIVYYYTTDKVKARLAKMLFPDVEVIDELEDGMKFDVIVGNPPFLKGTWQDFIRKSSKMSRGMVCMISPDGSAAFSGRAEKLRADLTSFGLISKADCTHYFPKVKSGKIVYYLIDRSKAGIPLDEPLTVEASILKKVFESPGERLSTFLSSKRGKADTSHHSESASTGKIKYLKSVTNTGFETVYANEDKIHVVSNSIDFWYTNRYFGKNNDCNLVEFADERIGISPNILAIKKPNGWSSSEFVRVYNNSRLFKYVLDTLRAGGFDTSPQHMNRLPLLRPRTWTDKEIYDHFGLTEEERLHIDPSYKA